MYVCMYVCMYIHMYDLCVFNLQFCNLMSGFHHYAGDGWVGGWGNLPPGPREIDYHTVL